MKILFFTDNFPPETNAAATRVYERACYWVKWGHQVTVITCAPNFPLGRLFPGYRNRWYKVEDMSGIRVVRIKTFIASNRGVVRRGLDFASFMASGFVAGLFQARPDVVVSTSPQFLAAVAGSALAAVRSVPFVFELGDLWPSSITAVGAMRENILLGWMEKLELYLYRKSAAVLALTDAFKDNLKQRGIDPDKIAVVINGVDLCRYQPMARSQALASEWGLDGKFVVGYVGTHGMAHALGNVLDTAQRLKDSLYIRFLFVGGGAERDDLIDDARLRGLDNVIFIDPQPKDKMPSVWSLCDVALIHLKNSPVFSGVIPSKIFEAMGMGLPLLLAAPKGEASDIIEATGAGFCVPPEDPAALADAVVKLNRDDGLRRDLAGRSHRAASGHSRERQARRMIKVLEMAAAGNGGEVGKADLG